MDNKNINQIVNFWMYIFYLFAPFKMLWNQNTEKKDGGDLYEDRCTVGASIRKNKIK